MIELFSNLATAFGLSSAAGLNAYLPLLVVAVTAKFTNLIQLNEPWNVMTDWWVIGVLSVLLLIEMTVDKIPAIDTLNDVLQTVGRPVAGAILFAASSGVIGDVHPVLAFVAGLLLAGGVHAIKATARPAVTASTLGTGNWVVSALEDVLALVVAVMSIIVPLLVAIFIVFMFFLFLWWRSRPFGKRTA
jgi:hypothetical protein